MWVDTAVMNCSLSLSFYVSAHQMPLHFLCVLCFPLLWLLMIAQSSLSLQHISVWLRNTFIASTDVVVLLWWLLFNQWASPSCLSFQVNKNISSDSEACKAGDLLGVYVISSSVVSQVGLYHDQQTEDGGSSKENRNIYSESMPRRVGSFYRGWWYLWPCLSFFHCRIKIKTSV